MESVNALNLVYHLADGYLNLGGQEANMIPSQLFNYISYGKPIIVYDPQCRGTEAYLNLAKEVLERNGN